MQFFHWKKCSWKSNYSTQFLQIWLPGRNSVISNNKRDYLANLIINPVLECSFQTVIQLQWKEREKVMLTPRNSSRKSKNENNVALYIIRQKNFFKLTLLFSWISERKNNKKVKFKILFWEAFHKIKSNKKTIIFLLFFVSQTFWQKRYLKSLCAKVT